MKKIVLAGVIALFAFTSCKNSATSGYDKTDNGLWYKKLSITGSTKAKIGDFLTVNFITHTPKPKDSVIADTRKSGGPMLIEVKAPAWKGDVAEGLTWLGTGDSASFLMPVDSLFKKGGGTLPQFLKHGDYLRIDIKVLSVKSRDEIMKEQAVAQAQATQQESGALDNYIKSNKIKAQQTASGLYYVIDKKGKGPLPAPGQSVTVNYTGMMLNGTVFDSSTKPGRQPFTFVLGKGQVIKGWDEGIPLLPVGSKGRLIIPSNLAYGPQGNQGIPPNSPLVFEIEVISVK
jgi:FKBP-type peptidyl-prolyl cis-trans isomerase FkpA